MQQKLWDGDIDIYNLEELKFCTKRAEKVYVRGLFEGDGRCL
ncbi:hypothetical protein HanXRQr2_Chr09g0380221 [Helianthus annuus]|uniref:Uncharacterized protein n=1 Tax=Helianthus annuus TaxID=4232 RepID=A0A9K3N8D3_HELAN|nr:hypothetical protein HanXRQr2_Chr09g0380221 [Helianthus annuus]